MEDGSRTASLLVPAVNLPEVQSPAAMNRRTRNSGQTDPAFVRIFQRGIEQKLMEVTKERGRGSRRITIEFAPCRFQVLPGAIRR